MAADTSTLGVPAVPPNNDSSRSLSVSSSHAVPGEYPGSSSALDPIDAASLSLTQAVHARRAEYTRPQAIKIKVGTWNVASFKDTDKDIGAWFVDPEDKQSHGDDSEAGIGIFVLGLQEVVDINSAVEAFRPYSAASTSAKFKAALQSAIPPGYRFIAEQQLTGLLLLIYAAPDIAPHVHSVSTTSAGTGLMGYMGNKGAVAARIVLGETTRLVFINAHLSSGLGKTELERRNWDFAQIVSRVRFEPIADTFGEINNRGERIGDEDFAFWFGDLNYRLEGVPGQDIRRILTLHTTNKYSNTSHLPDGIAERLRYVESKLAGSDISSTSLKENSSEDWPSDQDDQDFDQEPPADDPTSLQAILNSLLPHDELHQQQKAGKAFHDGWREGVINFLPTYKYDVGSASTFDSGEKKRGPSWCDRILYRTKRDRLRYEARAILEQQTKERDDQMTSQGIASAAEDENTMFEYDPENDGDDEYDDRSVQNDSQSATSAHEESDDTIRLGHYTSHQEIRTSDHKPLECVFTLTYDAVDFERKSKVQSEIARDLDRAENEGRPVVTVIVEGGSQEDDPDFDGADFGAIRYDDPKTCFITIANTGSVSAQFGFLDQPHRSDDAESLPPWLSIHFHYPSDNLESASEEGSSKAKHGRDSWAAGISKVFNLEPGDTTTVDLICHVKDKVLLRKLNNGDALDGILVLRVKDGRDHFLPVKGSWKSSVQGRTVDRLIRIPEGGVRALQGEMAVPPPDTDEANKQAVMWSAPREIFRLTESIESLTERITAEWSMLGTSIEGGARPPLVAYAGWPFVEESWTLDQDTRQRLRVDVNEALDTDRSFDSILSSRLPPLHRLEVFADALLDFLSNLEDGVIPAPLWERLDAEFFSKEKIKSKMSVDDKRAAILEILSSSQSHSISFVLLTSMLARISQDVVGAVQGTQPGAPSSAQIPDSPRVKVKRKSLDPNPSTATKSLIQMNFAAVFADLLIRQPDGGGKSKNTAHKRELIEVFLESTA